MDRGAGRADVSRRARGEKRRTVVVRTRTRGQVRPRAGQSIMLTASAACPAWASRTRRASSGAVSPSESFRRACWQELRRVGEGTGVSTQWVVNRGSEEHVRRLCQRLDAFVAVPAHGKLRGPLTSDDVILVLSTAGASLWMECSLYNRPSSARCHTILSVAFQTRSRQTTHQHGLQPNPPNHLAR